MKRHAFEVSDQKLALEGSIRLGGGSWRFVGSPRSGNWCPGVGVSRTGADGCDALGAAWGAAGFLAAANTGAVAAAGRDDGDGAFAPEDEACERGVDGATGSAVMMLTAGSKRPWEIQHWSACLLASTVAMTEAPQTSPAAAGAFHDGE